VKATFRERQRFDTFGIAHGNHNSVCSYHRSGDVFLGFASRRLRSASSCEKAREALESRSRHWREIGRTRATKQIDEARSYGSNQPIPAADRRRHQLQRIQHFCAIRPHYRLPLCFGGLRRSTQPLLDRTLPTGFFRSKPAVERSKRVHCDLYPGIRNGPFALPLRLRAKVRITRQLNVLSVPVADRHACDVHTSDARSLDVLDADVADLCAHRVRRDFARYHLATRTQCDRDSGDLVARMHYGPHRFAGTGSNRNHRRSLVTPPTYEQYGAPLR